MNEDASQGVGVLYLKGVPKNQATIQDTDFNIMFPSAGLPYASMPETSSKSANN